MRKLLVICFFIIFIGLHSLQVNFVSDNPNLSENLINEIKLFKSDYNNFLQNHPDAKIYITGYTDNKTLDDKKVSLMRAKIIKDYLVDNFDFEEQSIEIIGMGAENPVSSNDTPEEREKNNRVEIIFENPKATIKWFSNDVTYISSLYEKKHFAYKNDVIFPKDKISTGKKSRVGIELKNNDLLILEENSSMILYGNAETDRARLLDNKFHIELKSGRLFNKLNTIKENPINVKTPSAVLELHSKKNEIICNQNTTLISVYAGYVVALAHGKTIQVNEGFCLKIQKDRLPELPRKLPSAPINLHIVNRERAFGGESIKFGWSSNNSHNILQISENENFNGFIDEYEILGNMYSVNFDFGNYFARVKKVDNEGFSSVFSNVVSFSVKTTNVLGFANINPHKITRIVGRDFVLKGRVIDDNQVEIMGKIIPKDNDGYFSYDIELQDGFNKFTVAAVGSNGQRREFPIEIFYIKPIYEDPIFPDFEEEIRLPKFSYDYNIIITLPKGCIISFENQKYVPDELQEVGLWTTLKNGENKLDFLIIYPDGYEKTYSFSINYARDFSKWINRTIAATLGVAILLSPLFLY